jgi:hypothetical protein
LCVDHLRLTFGPDISNHPAEVDAVLNFISMVSSASSK